jgi:hypothetical protein
MIDKIHVGGECGHGLLGKLAGLYEPDRVNETTYLNPI